MIDMVQAGSNPAEIFRKLLFSQELISIKLSISPELAEQMLARNRNNRPIRPRVVAHYVDEILNGYWLTTSQGIAFDTEGILRDGQHRLRAIIESKTSVESFVNFGLNATGVGFIDTGTRKSVGSVLEEELGCSKGSVRAAICGVIMGKFHRTPEATKSTGEILRFYRTIENSIDWVLASYARFRSVRATAPHISALVLYREFAPDAAAEFLERIVNCVSDGKNDPAEKFRDACEIKTPRGGAGVRQDQFHRACHCVAAHHENREIIVLTTSEKGVEVIWRELVRINSPLYQYLQEYGRANSSRW